MSGCGFEIRAVALSGGVDVDPVHSWLQARDALTSPIFLPVGSTMSAVIVVGASAGMLDGTNLAGIAPEEPSPSAEPTEGIANNTRVKTTALKIFFFI
jgi:hypothetical protein